jgi:hypothetical protein
LVLLLLLVLVTAEDEDAAEDAESGEHDASLEVGVRSEEQFFDGGLLLHKISNRSRFHLNKRFNRETLTNG